MLESSWRCYVAHMCGEWSFAEQTFWQSLDHVRPEVLKESPKFGNIDMSPRMYVEGKKKRNILAKKTL